jgi:hydrogenase maturation factor
VLDLLFPPGATERSVEEVFLDIGLACKEHEITLVGGHTEITDAVARPVAVGVLMGTVKADRKVDPSRAQPGDRILLIGAIAVEGTAVLARERGEEIEEALGREFRTRAMELTRRPGICIRKPALLAVSRYLAHALHDPTEGGLATALRELGVFTDWGVEADVSTVEVLPETEAVCRLFGIDPFGLLASGSLLVVVPESEAARLERAAREILELPASVIGVLTDERRYVWKNAAGVRAAIPEFARDEVARVLERPRQPAGAGGGRTKE